MLVASVLQFLMADAVFLRFFRYGRTIIYEKRREVWEDCSGVEDPMSKSASSCWLPPQPASSGKSIELVCHMCGTHLMRFTISLLVVPIVAGVRVHSLSRSEHMDSHR